MGLDELFINERHNRAKRDDNRKKLKTPPVRAYDGKSYNAKYKIFREMCNFTYNEFRLCKVRVVKNMLPRLQINMADAKPVCYSREDLSMSWDCILELIPLCKEKPNIINMQSIIRI